jgi:hypothetical protein
MENKYPVAVTKWVEFKSLHLCICACRALGILEREVGAHDRRVGEATCALARIKAAKGQFSTLTDSYGSLIVTSIR